MSIAKVEYYREDDPDTLIVTPTGVLFAKKDGSLYVLSTDGGSWMELAPMPNSEREAELAWIGEPNKEEVVYPPEAEPPTDEDLARGFSEGKVVELVKDED
jgi:hypothetical protein